MGPDAIQSRISEIQMRIATLSPRVVTAPARPGSPVGVSAASGTQFAAALDAAMAAARPAPAPAESVWVAPTTGNVTSEYGMRWGRMHQGIDIGVPTGAPVRAASGGTVSLASSYGGYGNAVVIDHGDGVQTLYGHNSELLVRPGERVEPGQLIAKAGSTGDSTGPHLHFEVKVEGKAVDPRPWLAGRGVRL